MAPIWIIGSFLIALWIGKSFTAENVKQKILVGIIPPLVILALIYVGIGNNYGFNSYWAGAAMAGPILGCVSYIISSIIFIKIKKDEQRDKKENVDKETKEH